MKRKNLEFRLKALIATPIMMLLCLTSVFAQTTIKGKVIDAAGKSLPGVSVIQRGSKNGTVTDPSGNYSLVLTNNNSVIIFSSTGFETKSEAVGGRNSINITLTAQDKAMDEVIVTALGIRRQSRKLGYAASTVIVDEITQNRTTNVMTSLEGKIAGLDIAPPTAGAGASNRIRLRGQSGFNGQTNSPLIVINGLPMDQGARS
ncbi:MAG: carboxypeptidase-like regulatory domain-containing protein, partial [Ferruginibacter sp.]